jgi:phosphatidylglycerophosphate synthase
MDNISYKEIIEKCHTSKKDTYGWYYKHRLISLPLTKLFLKFDVQPNSISIWMIILSLISFLLMINDSSFLFWLGYFTAFMAFLFDKIDGDLARIYSMDNIKGTVLDFTYHRISLFLFYLGIGIHFSYENEYIVVMSAIAGFLANYIEEMQLLSYRVFAHKYLAKKENLDLQEFKKVNELKYTKILKLFRMQLLLFYYFIFGIIINYYFNIEISIFIGIALSGLIVYSIYQLYFVLKYSFDEDINKLSKLINQGKK